MVQGERVTAAVRLAADPKPVEVEVHIHAQTKQASASTRDNSPKIQRSRNLIIIVRDASLDSE